MWIEPWKREDWVISGAGLRYLNWAFWAQIPFFLALPFLTYCVYVAFQGRSTPLAYLPTRILLGIAGGICAIGGIILDDAMQVFQRTRYNAGELTSKMGRVTLRFGFFFGSAIYYWYFYRPRMLESRFREH
jgi:hypothetical protein